ncbi:MAG: TrkH family potassium uptake protein [Acidaminococcaceae bacterium]|nr:TrkH family potassium uptake protein [Acidaminococcaceae bacterium]
MDRQLVSRMLGKLLYYFSAALTVPLVTALTVDNDNIYLFVVSLLLSLGIAAVLTVYGCSTVEQRKQALRAWQESWSGFLLLVRIRKPEYFYQIFFLLHNVWRKMRILFISDRPKQRLRIREAIVIVGCGWLLVCFMGAIPYFFYGTLDPIAAIFESVSGFTTTGVTTAASFNEFPDSILVWRCMTHWFGGIGVIMIFITIMPQVNSGTGYLFNAELPGGMGERTLPTIKESASVIMRIYISFTVLEIILLCLGKVDFYQAVNLALATSATGGFSYYHDSLVSFDSVYVEAVAIIFMIIASINFSVYYRIWNREWKSFRENTTEIKYYLSILALATILIAANLYLSKTMDPVSSLRHAFFQSVSIGSTTGFASQDYNAWPSFSRNILFLLMFVGGCSGSSAGGLKVIRLVILFKAAWAELLRILHPNVIYSVKMGKKVIEASIVGNITRFFFIYITVFMVLTILISLEGLSIMESMGTIASCMSSVGPSFGIVGPTSTFSSLSQYARVICILAMLLGRLEIFTLLSLFDRNIWSNKHNW